MSFMRASLQEIFWLDASPGNYMAW
jgi:hypothetical protein